MLKCCSLSFIPRGQIPIEWKVHVPVGLRLFTLFASVQREEEEQRGSIWYTFWKSWESGLRGRKESASSYIEDPPGLLKATLDDNVQDLVLSAHSSPIRVEAPPCDLHAFCGAVVDFLQGHPQLMHHRPRVGMTKEPHGMALPLMEKNEEDVNVEAGRKNEKWYECPSPEGLTETLQTHSASTLEVLRAPAEF